MHDRHNDRKLNTHHHCSTTVLLYEGFVLMQLWLICMNFGHPALFETTHYNTSTCQFCRCYEALKQFNNLQSKKYQDGLLLNWPVWYFIQWWIHDTGSWSEWSSHWLPFVLQPSCFYGDILSKNNDFWTSLHHIHHIPYYSAACSMQFQK